MLCYDMQYVCRGNGGDLDHYFCIFYINWYILFIGRNTNPINNIDRILEEKGNVYNHL